MPTLRNGVFSFTIASDDLARGLRPSKRSPRNTKFLTTCVGAIGLDNVLQVLDDINEDLIDTSVIADGFPYPQMFVFTNLIIICGETKIYELVAGALVLKLTVTAGVTWEAIDFYDYVYMSNGKVAVIRRAEDKVWQTTTDLPIANGMCNFNGQVFVGAPDVEQV